MTYTRTIHTAAAASLVVCLLLLTSCSSTPKRYRVHGKVTYKGQPVRFGTINFRANDGTTGGGQVVDGRYDIPAIGAHLPPENGAA